MLRTPRMRSAYPSTPDSQTRTRNDGKQEGPLKFATAAPLSDAPRPLPPRSERSQPLIPLAILDAPTQRLYAAGVWGVLLVWRLYDWGNLLESDAASLWLFVKWTLIDAALLHLIPRLRIPWLEWSDMVVFWLFGLHTTVNGLLMFRIPVCYSQISSVLGLSSQLPIESSLVLLARTLFYDREYAISEHRVRPDSILNNASLIMGKQIINILPEGLVLPQSKLSL